MRITKTLLREHKACAPQLELFISTFPGGMDVTLDNCLECVRVGFNLYWGAEHLMSPPASKAYQEATAPAFVAAWRIHEAEIAEAVK